MTIQTWTTFFGWLTKEMLRYVANYKLLLTVFCFAPWLALTLMQ